MDVELDIELEERREDRVRVAFRLAPGVRGARVEGAALRLVDAAGRELCPRMLLPIAGRVSAPLDFTVELRTCGVLPEGARIVAVAWSGRSQAQATCPADPSMRLRDHLTGARLGVPAGPGLLEPVDDDLRARLERRFPWIAQPLRPPEVAGVLEAPDERGAADVVDGLGLDDDCAAWLKDLLDEDEDGLA